MTKNTAAITALRTEAARVGWPTSFATDLDHDERAIGAMAPHEPFTWCLRAAGTHIGVAFDPYTVASRLTMAMVASAFGATNCTFYVWDGRALHAVDSAAAADARLAEIVRELSWTCVTCCRRGRGIAPAQCPSCRSDRDERHGPHAGDVGVSEFHAQLNVQGAA